MRVVCRNAETAQRLTTLVNSPPELGAKSPMRERRLVDFVEPHRSGMAHLLLKRARLLANEQLMANRLVADTFH